MPLERGSATILTWMTTTTSELGVLPAISRSTSIQCGKANTIISSYAGRTTGVAQGPTWTLNCTTLLQRR